MKMLKRVATAMIAGVAALIFTGCDGIFAAPSAVISPPKLAGSLAGLDDALDNTLKEKYEFAYPSKGEYKAACITKDLNSDGTDEALVFYIPEGDGMLHLNLFTAQNGVWKSLSDIDLQSSGVEKVEFENVRGDAAPEVIVSSLLYSTTDTKTHRATVFTFGNNGLEACFQENCADFALCNILANGYKQLMVFNVGTVTSKTAANTAQTATARLIGLANTGKEKSVFYGEAPMDPDISSIALTTEGKVDNNTALFVDSNLASGSMITSLLIYNQKSKTLTNALYDKTTANNNVSLRFAPIVSQDFDGDGSIEIPVSHVAAKDDKKSENMMLSWTGYSGGKLTVKYSGYYNSEYNYYFSVDEKWTSNITVKSENDGELIVYSIASNVAGAGKTLLTVAVTPHSEDDTDKPDVKPTYSTEDYDFTVYMPNDAPAVYAQSKKTILESFKVIK